MKVFVMLLMLGLLMCPRSYAALDSGDPSEKIVTGMSNVMSGWMEVPRNIDREVRNKNMFTGFFVGLAKGVFLGIGRTASGALDIATFAIPPYRKPFFEPDARMNES